MKIIFSRKGFDSSYGGHPSPILQNGDLLSIPIPSKDERLSYKEIYVNKDETYLDILKIILKGKRFKNVKDKVVVNEEFNYKCHLDPDLRKMSLRGRLKEWKPAFGQVGHSQTHLSKQGIQEGDLFLFFGWFRQTEMRNNKMRFVTGVGEDRHILFGYLQIGKILKVNHETKILNWLRNHPHCERKDLLQSKNNCVYIGKEYFDCNKRIPGGGVFKFNEELVLTKPGFSRSKWGLDPKLFRHLKISRHSEKSWKDGFFKSVDIGQEFVVHADKPVINWAKNLVLSFRSEE